MLELARGAGGEARLGFGGDTFNTALYLTRLGAAVQYATALGSDPWSDEMRAAWRDEGIGLDLILTDPHRQPGLYAIRTDSAGERSFSYWRSDSAARQFFALPGSAGALAKMAQADLLYLSGITLSLFDAKARERLIDVVQAVRRRGGAIAFDPNYRPRNWAFAGEARAVFEAFAPLVSIALPTFEDEVALHNDVDPAGTARRWLAQGAEEVVVKLGPEGALLATADSMTTIRTIPVPAPVDTTGAGDSFNAAYLHARLSGASCDDGVRAGHALAHEVVQHHGAIMPKAR